MKSEKEWTQKGARKAFFSCVLSSCCGEQNPNKASEKRAFRSRQTWRGPPVLHFVTVLLGWRSALSRSATVGSRDPLTESQAAFHRVAASVPACMCVCMHTCLNMHEQGMAVAGGGLLHCPQCRSINLHTFTKTQEL